ALAFAPDNRSLAVGEHDGGIRSWELPDGKPRPRVPPQRGQVVALGVSDDGRYLLQVTRDREAMVWDLEQGRSPTRLEGAWTTGALSPDGARAALIDADRGEVVVVDRETGRHLPTSFPRPPGSGEGWRFGLVAFSRDRGGPLLAAGSAEP